MNLTKIVLKRPVAVCIIILSLVVFGVMALFTAPMELMPNMEMPMMYIITSYPNAGPEEVEELVTQHVEDALSTLSGIKKMSSTSSEGVSYVLIDMNYGTNMDVARMDIQEKLGMISMVLPQTAQKPIILQFSTDMMPVMVLSAEKVGDIDLLTYIDQEIKPEFEKLAGVAKVDVYGDSANYISVTLDEQRMKQYKLDITMLSNIVKSADFTLPAGYVDRGDMRLPLRGSASYTTMESLVDIPITLVSGQVIRLGDVAHVYQATGEASSVSRYNGRDNVAVLVSKLQNASTVDVAKLCNRTIERMNGEAKGVTFSVIDDSSEEIITSVKSVMSTLLLGIILSMVILFIFFGDLRASLIVGSSMPVSVLTSLVLMNMMGFSLNTLSLGGLVIGVGMMVDNSIVVLDSCYLHRDRQVTYAQAALEGTNFVTASVIAGTLTTVVVYLPISLMKGMSGQLFQQLGFTIIFSLTASLISAMTLVPLLFMRIKPNEKKNMFINRILHKVEHVYGSFLKKSFRVKPLVIIVSVGLLVGTVMLVASGAIPMEMMPETDEGNISIEVKTKPGLKLTETDNLLRGIEEMVAQGEDTESYSITGNSGSASLTVYLKDKRKTSTFEWVDIWREQTKDRIDCDISVKSSTSMGAMGGGGDVGIPIQGNDYDIVKEASRQVEDMMREHPDLVRVTSTVSSGSPQAEIVVDPIKAGINGFTPKQIIEIVNTTISGSKTITLTRNAQKYDVTLEFPKDRYNTVTDLGGMILVSSTGKQIPLLDVATIEFTNAPESIERQNNQYVVTVTGQPKTEAKLTANDSVMAKVNELILPNGITIGMSQQMESMKDEFTALLIAIATAVFLVFVVMAIQFESARFSILVMLCIPFSMVGAFGGLFLSGSSISMPSLMGFLTLVGTVINNGILFIDTANQYRVSMDAETALITAGRTRLRPILMTTLTTVLAMVPLSLGIGSAGDAMKGMAIVIIGGLVASTLLTLLLLPTFYLLFGGADKKEKKNKRNKKGRKNSQAPNDEIPPMEEFTTDHLLQS